MDAYDADTIEWEDLNLLAFLSLGSTISIGCDSVLYPFDLIKTRLQVQGRTGSPKKSSPKIESRTSSKSSSPSTSFPRYRGLWHAVRSIRQNEGVSGFYKGFGANICGSLPAEMLYYVIYESGKHTWKKLYPSFYQMFPSLLPNEDDAEAIGIFLAGGVAELASASIWIPTDIVAQKLMVQGNLKTPKYKNIRDCVKTVAQNDGWRGFYRGWIPTALTFVPAGAVQWVTYEAVRKRLYHYYAQVAEEDELDIFHTQGPSDAHQRCIHVLSGTIAGTCAAAVTNPMDVLKTRLQVQDYYSRRENVENALKPRAQTARQLLRQILKEEGVGALFSGMQARILYSAPAVGLTMLTYEMVKKLATHHAVASRLN